MGAEGLVGKQTRLAIGEPNRRVRLIRGGGQNEKLILENIKRKDRKRGEEGGGGGKGPGDIGLGRREKKGYEVNLKEI